MLSLQAAAIAIVPIKPSSYFVLSGALHRESKAMDRTHRISQGRWMKKEDAMQITLAALKLDETPTCLTGVGVKLVSVDSPLSARGAWSTPH